MDKVSHHLGLSDNSSGYKGELKRDSNLLYGGHYTCYCLFIYLAVLGLHRWVGFSLAEAPGLLIALFIVCFPS